MRTEKGDVLWLRFRFVSTYIVFSALIKYNGISDVNGFWFFISVLYISTDIANVEKGVLFISLTNI